MKPGHSGVVLLYNCGGQEYFKLKQIFSMLRLRMHPVPPTRYHLPLEDLALGRGEEGEAPEEVFQEPMLVFCGMGQAFLHQVLNVLRTAQLPQIDCKAVLTETNRSWNSLQLYEQLKQEHEALHAPKSAAPEEAGPDDTREEARTEPSA